MATVHIVVAEVQNKAERSGTTVPVLKSAVKFAETVTTIGASVIAGITSDQADDFWSITCTGGNAWIAFGPTPSAASGSGWLILDGQTREFSVGVVGEKIATRTA